ncbi:MAG: hypothetical protein ACI361_03480 [Atopobiaceae bacterium]
MKPQTRRKLLLLGVAVLATITAAFLLRGQSLGTHDEVSSGSVEEGSLSDEASRILAGSGRTLPEDVSSEDTQSYTVDKPLKTVSSQLMESYEDRGDCVLLEAQYLDLLGKVWGFSVEGQGWADVCILKETGSGKTEVEIIHLAAAEGADGS